VVCFQEVLGKNWMGQGQEMRICAVIPAFNEAGSILQVIKGVQVFGVEAIVVDDGSSDETSLIAQRQGAHIVRHNRRSGKGLSLRDGFNYAVDKEYDLVFTIDGDGQHDPSDIPLFLDKFQKLHADVVIGNRMSDPANMPFIRIITNKFMSQAISIICHQNIPDTQCGYRLFTRQAISNIDIKSRKFEIESEILVKLSRQGLRIGSVPVKSIYAGETSKIRPVRDSLRFIRFMARAMVKK
jgi:glycosyltransferase involved in cell wall biosynthesis